MDFRPVPVGPPDKRRGGCTAASQVAAILSAPTDMVKVVLALSQFEKCQIGMKEALVLLGKLPRAVVRPPLVKIERAEVLRIRQALIEAGLLDKNARDAA